MITVSAKITIGDSVDLSVQNISGSNGSKKGFAQLSEMTNKLTQAKNPFMLSQTALGSGNYTFQTAPLDYYSQEEGSVSFELVGDKPFTSFAISFDNYNKRYARSILIDGSFLFSNDDVVFYALNLESKKTHTVRISSWSASDSRIVITGIYCIDSIEINNRNIFGFDCEILDRADISLPSYGIISNKGSIAFRDVNEIVKQSIENGQLLDGSSIDFYIKNTLTNKTFNCSGFYIGDISYDEGYVTASFNDGLEALQQTEFSKVIVDNTTAKEIYDILVERTKKSKFNFAYLDSYTSSFLSSFIIRLTYLLKDNLWNQWNRLAYLCGLHIYKNNNGEISVVYGN